MSEEHHCHSYGKIWFSASQAGLQRRALLEVQMDAREVAFALPMWESVLGGACFQLSERSLALNQAQLWKGHHDSLAHRSVPKCRDRAHSLQPLISESFPLRSTNIEEGARLLLLLSPTPLHPHKGTGRLGQQQEKCLL